MTEENMSVDLPDEDIELEEEQTHDMKNAEAQSIASVEKAEDGTKRAPARKGDNLKAADPMPKTKAAFINAMYTKLSGMKKDQLTAAYAKMSEELGDIADEEVVELPETSYDFSDDLSALVESEATLSDEFKAKTAVIFETAIRSKVSAEVERLENEYQTKLDEEIQVTRDDLVEKVDNYLNYVVETWMEENKVGITTGLRTEIAEDFMSSLRNLFEESYIEVPESKVDLVDELAEQVEELESKLNAQTESAIELSVKLESSLREAVIRESSRDLADTEIEKLESLVSTLEFEDEASFSLKVKTVKEAYFSKKTSSDVEEIEEDWEAPVVADNTAMARYLQAIEKSTKE